MLEEKPVHDDIAKYISKKIFISTKEGLTFDILPYHKKILSTQSNEGMAYI